MSRLARIVVPDVPHHITQRGNRRQEVFFSDEDYLAYKELIAEACAAEGVRCIAWCLMPNHVHLILVPPSPDALRGALADAHRCYSRQTNFARGWTGYLWQRRFASYPMDEAHLMTAVRYVELNPELSIVSPEPEAHERTGRPWGDKAFVAEMERRTGRKLARQEPAPKPARTES